MKAAPVGSCSSKIGYGIIKMRAQDCNAMGGKMNGSPSSAAWTDCHVDWCTDGVFSPAAVGKCEQKVGTGIIQASPAKCTALRAEVELTESELEDAEYETDCYLDWCRDGTYAVAALDACPNFEPPLTKVRRGTIKMQAADCEAMGGTTLPTRFMVYTY